MVTPARPGPPARSRYTHALTHPAAALPPLATPVETDALAPVAPVGDGGGGWPPHAARASPLQRISVHGRHRISRTPFAAAGPSCMPGGASLVLGPRGAQSTTVHQCFEAVCRHLPPKPAR